MAQTYDLLHSGADPSLTPGEVLRRVNRQLLAMGTPSLFVTVLYGVLDSQSGQFTYARAGHEPPLLKLPSGEVCPATTKDGQPLGFMEDPLLDEQVITIPPGATLLLYTDGITDWCSLDKGFFGRGRLNDALAAVTGTDTPEVCAQLWQALQSFGQKDIQCDDATLVRIRSSEQ
jgi:sigma-B regulation protein RsbU (phosphoserine phosphatase)